MIHVFTGPTLPADDDVLKGGRVRVRPPVRHGDLFGLAIAGGDAVVLVDGVYHQHAAVRHKEILALLARGVRVIGAASIGALRAVELEVFGMEPVGRVAEGFRSGRLVGDDEVAVGQDPQDATAVTWPLVNVREVLASGVAAGVLERRAADEVLEALRAVFYPQRTWAAVRAVCRQRAGAEFVEWLAGQRERYPRFGDVKYADARAAVLLALVGDGQEYQCVGAGGGVRAGAVCWDSGYFRRWRNDLAVEEAGGRRLPTRLRLAYQQVFDPLFPVVWWRFLEELSLRPGDGSAGMPLTERMAPYPGLPVHAVFRVEPDLSDPRVVELLLGRETRADRAAVARYAEADARARRTVVGYVAEAVRDEVAVGVLTSVWGCGEDGLDEAAAVRGLRSGGRAVEVVKPFVMGLYGDRRRGAVAAGAGRAL
ncbi:TfuA-like protein [Streptomyces sp. NBC_00670]|uniref:TfuA-like protein n=1 Tax=Streptomyces sp. NBC_00670 TaxID=2975804 RepID=UPI002E350B23|nr:TfuA-like protein [Streptomyces sp. NBC_00670]